VNFVAAEQSYSEQHKTQEVYARKLDKIRESAATLTWRNILGNALIALLSRFVLGFLSVF